MYLLLLLLVVFLLFALWLTLFLTPRQNLLVNSLLIMYMAKLRFTFINMVRVHYQLFGEWYAVDMPDMPTAIAFARDFIEYWFEKF